MPILSSIRTSVENQQALILDPHAKNGLFCRDARGRLIAYTGGFSIVFPYEVNHEKWAFRCWYAELGNVRRRFEIITRAIQQTKAPYLCDFTYVDEGIIVDGKIYPTTRMRWVDGENIKDYLCHNKTKKATLNKLAKNFLALVQDMHRLHLAHGDLQHGNIIVGAKGELFLVDYDSFYCDDLKGEPDIIIGLKDYQHPLRKQNQVVSEKIDYFSELIIYLSILGIAAKPQLVETYQVENAEHMLFEADDFSHLRSSRIYQELHGMSFEIDMLLLILEQYLSASSINDLRPFDIVQNELVKEPEIHSFLSSCGNKCIIGHKTTFSWSVENYTSITLNGIDVTKQSSYTVPVNSSGQYILTVSNGNKITSKSLHIDALDAARIAFSSDKNKLHKDKNETIVLSWNVLNALKIALLQDGQIIRDHCQNSETLILCPNKDTTFTLQVVSSDGVTITHKSVSISVFPEATFSFTSDKEYVLPSIPFTLTWKTTHAKKVELNGRTIAKEGSYCMKDGIAKETSFTLRVTDEFGTKEQTISVKMLPLPRIESIVVPIPNIEQSTNLQISLAVPDISIQLPTYVQKELELLPSEVYDIQIDTSAAPSPPEVKLIELHTDNSWTTKLQLLAKKLHNRLHNEIN